jgi:hypothetical protein
MSDEARNEYISERLLDRDEEYWWQCSRGAPRVTTEQMVARVGAERAAVEAEWAERAAVEYGRLRWVAQLALNREAQAEAAA